MAKRFSETTKWSDEWFTSLKPLPKLVFLYIIDNCDNAGFYEINTRVASFLIGITPEQFTKAIDSLEKCFVFSIDKKILWIKNFLKHQKNLPLNNTNNAHKQIFFLLLSNEDKFELPFEILGAKQGLISPIGKGNGNGNGNGNGKDNDIVEDVLEESIFRKNLIEQNVPVQLIEDWIKIRSQKKGSDSISAWQGFEREVYDAKISYEAATRFSVEKGYHQFKAEYYRNSMEKNFAPKKETERENLKDKVYDESM